MFELRQCQAACHDWGRRNQVSFDSDKEEFAVLHKVANCGPDFRLLGTHVDTRLSMNLNIEKIIAKARPKITALLRACSYYSQEAMVTQFRTHVLCLLETSVGGFYHATSSALSSLDRLQDSFLREIGLRREQGLMIYNLAPLATRRDIAMLGLIFRCATGKGHVGLQALFPAAPPVGHISRAPYRELRHAFGVQSRRDNNGFLCGQQHFE